MLTLLTQLTPVHGVYILREDGLAALQSEELSAQRQNLTQQWERERDERTQRALKRAQVGDACPML